MARDAPWARHRAARRRQDNPNHRPSLISHTGVESIPTPPWGAVPLCHASCYSHKLNCNWAGGCSSTRGAARPIGSARVLRAAVKAQERETSCTSSASRGVSPQGSAHRRSTTTQVWVHDFSSLGHWQPPSPAVKHLDRLLIPLAGRSAPGRASAQAGPSRQLQGSSRPTPGLPPSGSTPAASHRLVTS